MHYLIPAWLWLIELMYKYFKSASESSSFAKRGSQKIGVLGIPGKVCTVFVQQIWKSLHFLQN
jgi:hypothetical protein